MSAARKPAARPRRLVLVRGGLDGSHTGDGDGDWEDFCRRIGWQTPAPAPDDDFERRLQEGLLAIPMTPDNAVEIEGARSNSGVRLRPWLDEAEEAGAEYALSSDPEYRRSGVHAALDVEAVAAADVRQSLPRDVGQSLPRDVWRSLPRDVWQSLPRRGLVRAGVAAAMLAIAAAAALAVTHLATSPAGSKAALIVAPVAERGHAAAPDADEHAVEGRSLDAPLRLETGPVRATSAPTAKPAPSPTSPRVEPSSPPDTKPEPPGMRVARRALDDGAMDTAVTEGRAVELARDVRQSLPHDVRQSLPRDVRQSLPREDGLAKWDRSRRDAHEISSAEARPVMASLDLAGRPGAVADPAAMRAAAVRSLVARPAAAPAQPAVAPAREALPDVTLATVDSGAAPAVGDGGGDVWAKVPAATRPAVPEGAQATNGSWSLAGAKDRWVGASLTAPPQPIATSNIGVIVQLDLGKALDRL